MEEYRSGHNGADSKSVGSGKTGTRVRIPPLPQNNMQNYWLKISSEALKDPCLLNDYTPVLTRIDHKPEADNPYWHVHIFKLTKEELKKFANDLNNTMKSGWYALAFNDNNVWVIMKEKTTILEREDTWQSEAYLAMQEYAEAHGVQREYLDFNERFEEYTSWATELENTDRRSLHHVALAVDDIDETAKWYQRHFGFSELHRDDSGEPMFRMLEKDGFRLELISSQSKHKPLPEYRKDLLEDVSVTGTKHFCLQVPDVHAEYERLKAAGVDLRNEPRPTYFGGYYLFVKDNNGILFELWSQK